MLYPPCFNVKKSDCERTSADFFDRMTANDPKSFVCENRLNFNFESDVTIKKSHQS
jgi:hypothetical protein